MRKLKTKMSYEVMSLDNINDVNDVMRTMAHDIYGDFNEFFNVYDDLQFEAIGARLTSPSGKAVYDYVNGGINFDNAASSSDYITIVMQMPHRWAQGTGILPHIHWVQTSASNVAWRMKYRWYNNGGSIPSFSSAISPSTQETFPYQSGSILQISQFPEIAGSDYGTSSFLDVYIYRDAGDAFSGTVLLKQFDIHYIIDSNGSRDEYIKEI